MPGQGRTQSESLGMDVVQLLGVSALVGAVGACFLIGLARFSSTWKAAKGNAVATKLIDRHIEALYRRRRTILIPDDYGVIRNNLKKEWEKEKTHFIQNVVHPELVRTGRRSWIPYFSEPLFGATLDQRLAAYEVDRPEDAEITGPTASGTDYEHLCAALLRKAGWSLASRPGLTGKQGQEPREERLGHPVRYVPEGLARDAMGQTVAKMSPSSLEATRWSVPWHSSSTI